MAKFKKQDKAKLNLTVRDEHETNWTNGLFRDRSVSNLIEVRADERWEAISRAAGGCFTLKPCRSDEA